MVTDLQHEFNDTLPFVLQLELRSMTTLSVLGVLYNYVLRLCSLVRTTELSAAFLLLEKGLQNPFTIQLSKTTSGSFPSMQ